MSILDLFRLDGKVALVTGAARGIGKAISLALSEAGADISALSKSDSSSLCQTIQAYGGGCLSIQCDLARSNPSALSQIVDQVVQRFGRLDILVNNAGIVRRAPVLQYTEADWDEVMQVNLKSLFFLSQAAARVMEQNGGGKIINIASLLSFQGGILVPPYTASKSAVAGLTRLMANELASKSINVNAIAPGYMATDNTAALRSDPVRNKAILERIPAGRWGNAEDVAGAAVFLASPASDYMHGAIIAVDGGWLAR